MERAVPFLLLAAIGPAALAQTAYPDHVVQDVSWNDDVHHIAVTQPILSPGVSTLPVAISGTADVEFVSATQVRLGPGFHAGGFSEGGQFRAHIDAGLGTPGDVVIVAQEPYSAITDNVVHVHKWEKLEIGLQLPQEYQDAIDRFFEHYYSNGTDQPATPGVVDQAHDLNPYADDSLQLAMTLISPTGQQRMKWGFFMREAKWASELPTARLAEHMDDPLHPYHIRFRFAPDEEGPWQFALSVKAPHTTTLADHALASLSPTGYQFVCEPPLPDNKGPLSVHPANRRILRFEETEEPFIALGVNMADQRHIELGQEIDPGSWWYTYYRRDFNKMQESMSLMHEMGGNFMRMFLMDKIFAPEYVNLGVYDAYRIPTVCDLSESSDPNEGNCDRGWSTGFTGNCQYQTWAFDRMLDQARDNNIYIQLCIDPYPPIIAYEKMGWGAHAYTIHYLDPARQAPPNNPYDMKGFFYKNGNPQYKNEGVFYHWKRKYKYIMSRWGWSVNLAVLEPFNEIDQMLSYQDLPDGLGSNAPVANCYNEDFNQIQHRDICRENRGNWNRDPGLPGVISDWITDIAAYVRGDVEPDDPVHSPLGEADKLFLMSYTDAKPANNTAHYLPFTNPSVDLIDVHKGIHPNLSQQGSPDVAMTNAFNHASSFRTFYPSTNPAVPRKPFNHGEFNYYTHLDGWDQDIEKGFHNYDVSFHNEIWASAFSGKFAAGTTWHWERVFWWEDALEAPPPDLSNQFQPLGFSNVLGDTNILHIGSSTPVPVTNRRIHHHFKPLADLLAHPSWTAYGFFNADYTANHTNGPSTLESYYLKNTAKTVAIGWLHNRNAWVMKSYYLRRNLQNLLGCAPPTTGTFALTGFAPNTPFFITWFPTRMNSTVHPPPMEVTSNGSGTITLDLTGHFGGTANNYLDTLRSDYAFIITPEPFVKSLPLPPMVEEPPMEAGWDFVIYPNPARDELFLRMPDDTPQDIALHDLAGRLAGAWGQVTGPLIRLPLSRISRGAYWIRVSNGTHVKAKKLIIH